MVNAQLIF